MESQFLRTRASRADKGADPFLEETLVRSLRRVFAGSGPQLPRLEEEARAVGRAKPVGNGLVEPRRCENVNRGAEHDSITLEEMLLHEVEVVLEHALACAAHEEALGARGASRAVLDIEVSHTDKSHLRTRLLGAHEGLLDEDLAVLHLPPERQTQRLHICCLPLLCASHVPCRASLLCGPRVIHSVSGL